MGWGITLPQPLPFADGEGNWRKGRKEKEKVEVMSRWTLRFVDASLEKEYNREHLNRYLRSQRYNK